jgi:hypothetical protein
MHQWIEKLGPIADCKPCASLDVKELQLAPKLEWLNDTGLLKEDLTRIYARRSAAAEQFYVTQVPNIGRPQFANELPYKDIQFPDVGFQLLSLFRFWNIVEYWAPYRDQIGEDWDGVLRQSIARVTLARNRQGYELEMIAVIARIHDTHANLWSSLAVRPPVGDCSLPVIVRFVEGRAVVTAYADEEAGKASGLQVGDMIEAMDGSPVDKLIQAWRPYYAASNEPTRLRDMARGFGAGACGPLAVRVRRASGPQELTATRVSRTLLRRPTTHDRAGDTFQLLPDNIAYIKLSSIKRTDIPMYLKLAAASKGLIIDIRNYPSDFVPFALGQHLLDRPTDFVRFTVGDLSNPGAFHWGPQLKIEPQQRYYAGKVMILLDETSQSQSEFTAMALRVGVRAKVIGSTTAGADGNISPFSLPGGLSSMISGIGVFYPGRQPTQRVGILPDIEVKPTIRGIRAGLDEVLDAAIAEIRRD